MLPAVLNTYGGQKVNATPVKNNQAQYGAGNFNRAHEDLAQATRTVPRVAVLFPTLTGDGFVPPASVQHRNVWGIGTPTKPTVERTASGLYTVQWATSYNDGLNPPVPETVALLIPIGIEAFSPDVLDVVDSKYLTVGANSVTIKVLVSGALGDVGNNSAVVFNVALTLI